MLDVGLMYAMYAGVALIVILLLHNRVRTTEYKEIVDRPLCFLLIFFAVFCTVDMVWGLETSFVTSDIVVWYVISTYGFHLCAALSAFFWAGYVMTYLKVSGKHKIILNALRFTLFIAQASVLVSNIWTHIFFDIDADGVYHAYEMRDWMFVIQFAYYGIIICYSLAILVLNAGNAKNEARRCRVAILFSCVPLTFGFLQMMFPDGPMYSIGFMLTAILIYSFNITADREKYFAEAVKAESEKYRSIASVLSDDASAVYYVDLGDNTYECIRKEVVDGELKNVSFKCAKDFFVEMRANYENRVHPDDYSKINEGLDKNLLIENLVKTGMLYEDIRILENGNYRYYRAKVSKSSFADEINKIVIGIFDEDDAVRKEIQQKEELKDLMQKAEEANAAKTSFLFNMSHDIRTPMNAILGFIRIAQKHMDDKETLEKSLVNIQNSGEHLLALINDILDMARIESGKLTITEKPESIDSINDQIIPIVMELASAKSLVFQTDVSKLRDRFIYCDKLHLNQVILNVLTNAIKYTNPGGDVFYEVEQLDDDKKVIYKFTVRDTGVGMTDEFVSKIFEAFERAENASTNKVEGTGLGMSIVKKLVEAMNGTISIDSRPGMGTKVEIIIAFNRAEERQIVEEKESEAEEEKKDPSEILKGKRVLLTDDNVFNREIARDMLEDMGILVDEATDGLNAIDILTKADKGYYDLVFMDIQMPGVDGYETTRRIRAMEGDKCKDIPIVAMTANAFDDDKANALAAGMNAHMSKPIKIKTLIKILEEQI